MSTKELFFNLKKLSPGENDFSRGVLHRMVRKKGKNKKNFFLYIYKQEYDD